VITPIQMMSDNEEEIDVCAVDDEVMNIHAGLTAVAAETYVDTGISKEIDISTALIQAAMRNSKENVKAIDPDINSKSKNSVINKEVKDEKIIRPGTPKNMKIKEVTTERSNKDPTRDTHMRLVAANSNNANPDFHRCDPPVTNEHEPTKVTKKAMDSKENHVDDDMSSDSEDEIDRGSSNVFKQFSFESDHLALKKNKDYQLLLKTMMVLEAQRAQAIKDLENLHHLKLDALSDPIKFVHNLQEKKSMGFPDRQNIAKLPDIDWLQYMTSSSDADQRTLPTRKGMMQRDRELMAQIAERENELFQNEEEFIRNKNEQNAPRKAWEDGKPVMFNQPWTAEEQEKLEKLLLVYPPEDVETRRWEKIAKALGNRTSKQVSSRVQKYFIKLAKAKLPIPGRNPSTLAVSSKTKMNPVSFKNSTFFPSWRPQVNMEDYELKEDLSSISSCAEQSLTADDDQYSDDESIPKELRDTEEYQELIFLRQMKKRQRSRSMMGNVPTEHQGFMCDGCGMDPIIGIRWHCKDCPSNQSIDFCNNCYQSAPSVGGHTSEHYMESIQESTPDWSHVDGDYTQFKQRHFKYNYLDPNFLPSNDFDPS